MFYYRPASERGRADFGWLQSNHSFSFGNYFDPKHMGVSMLRVINDDTVAPGAGFDTHGHHDMEIISYVLEGAIEHRDSMGNQFVVPAGEVQRMTAGTGITHSEFNHSQSDPLKFLQIWVIPNKRGLTPGYEQKEIVQNGSLTPLVTPDGREGSLMMHQDVSISRLVLAADESITIDTGEGQSRRAGYLHVINGGAKAANYSLVEGDGLGVIGEPLSVKAGDQGITALWFDLPPAQFPLRDAS
ncbi:pirin family protein [Porticoccaceae bacterium LTM1]|nr:pirin family protein [Porticoccaceae bacterium LTM1]